MVFIEGRDFSFIVPDDSSLITIIKLLRGKYAGVVYHYGKVGVKEEDGVAYLQFNYYVLESPIEGLEGDEEFKNYIGYLLTQFITTHNMEQTDENRDDNT